MSFRAPAPNVGRFTAVILFLVVFLCVAMIGGTGYLKYQMDRAQSLLAAPDAAIGSDLDMFDRLRRDLGYGGFLGLAQDYAMKHDASGFAEMKEDIKSADDIVAHLPDRTPAETRHDLTAIVSAFDGALQKINAPASESTSEFTMADLAPLYAAMPVLDARVSSANAGTRLAAQKDTQFWGMLLTLVSWCSLIIAAACAAGIYLTLRDKHSAPMRALAQSIQNMARGDMRTAIWGTERQDMIGELARAVDIARYHFSHLPDLSLLSEQGPVRMRFEGGSRSLFEAMMKAISRDSETIRDQTLTLTEAVKQQKESIALISEKVETVLGNILQHGHDGDKQIRQAIHEMVASAENLKNAHAHAADQLNRLVPTLQDRAAGMAEIAHITGKQVSQTLQALTVSEMSLKANADLAKDTLGRLSSTADDLGERLFGAINLLQASGKVLAETTENMQGRAPSASAQERGAFVASAPSADMLAPLAAHLERIATQIEDMQNRLEQRNDSASVAPTDSRDSEILSHIQGRIEELAAGIERQTASGSALSEIANDKFDLALLSGFAQLLAERVEPKFATLEQTIGQKIAQNSAERPRAADETQNALAALAADMQKKFAALAADIEHQAHNTADKTGALSSKINEALAELGGRIVALPAGLRDALQGNWSTLSAQMEMIEAGLDRHADVQKQEIVEHASLLSARTQEALIALGDRMEAVAAALPGDVRRTVETELRSMSAQMNGIRAAVEQSANGIEPKFAAMENSIERHTQDGAAQMAAVAANLHDALLQVSEKITAIADALPPELRGQMQEDWNRLSAQIEASRGEFSQSLLEHINPKLASLGTDIVNLLGSAETTQQNVETVRQLAQATQDELSRPPQPITYLLPPELQQQMRDHWYQIAAQIEASRTNIDKMFGEQVGGKLESFEKALAETRKMVETVREQLATPPKTVFALPPELQKQMHDHWFQVAAQIEASRASLIETVSHQIEGLENRIGGRTATPSLSRTAADYATQRQIEQQTQILSELVATLGVLDAHMQQIKTDMHATGK